ncbi:MAG: glycerate kinase [Phycisphaerales bacterium]|nr:MAG: glycerate kinase [Phycisphaerales bacterium]
MPPARTSSLRRIVCAPDSFKETIAAADAARAMAAGIAEVDSAIEVDCCPVADGGEGTLDALLPTLDGREHRAVVTGPRGQPIEARYGLSGDQRVGIVELAEASGLALLSPHERDPMQTTTFGTGELIDLAARAGCDSIIVCIGGSATVDGGSGIMQALGSVFYDRDDQRIHSPMTGGMLARLGRVERQHIHGRPRLRVACDVTNPLCGENGAAAMYGPQKGATPDMVRELDRGLMHFAGLLQADPTTPGFGAAGGASLGLVAGCDAQLERGVDLVLDALDFRARCEGADLVITGEGQLDAQSLTGKTTMGVAKLARSCGVRTIAIVGAAGPGAERCRRDHPDGFLDDYVSLSELVGEERARNETADAIREAARRLMLALIESES